ncbi:MAG: hypothetical protein LBQ66_01990 [Planctomycetaceae bacterium]|nr:hypothetical protein [Planctomycetaceae bacterium]
MGRFGFANTCSAPLFSSCFARRKRNRPAVGYPPYDHQHVLAFLPNLFGCLMHRGGRDARVPVRAASRQLSATPTGDGLEYQPRLQHHFVGGKPPSIIFIMRMHL